MSIYNLFKLDFFLTEIVADTLIKLLKPSKDRSDLEDSVVVEKIRIERNWLASYCRRFVEKLTWQFRMFLYNKKKYIKCAIHVLLVFYSPSKTLLGIKVIDQETLKEIGSMSKFIHYCINSFFSQIDLLNPSKRRIVETDGMSDGEKRIAAENNMKEKKLYYTYCIGAILNICLRVYDGPRGGVSYRFRRHKAIKI
jgi:hypothetical protein